MYYCYIIIVLLSYYGTIIYYLYYCYIIIYEPTTIPGRPWDAAQKEQGPAPRPQAVRVDQALWEMQALGLAPPSPVAHYCRPPEPVQSSSTAAPTRRTNPVLCNQPRAHQSASTASNNNRTRSCRRSPVSACQEPKRPQVPHRTHTRILGITPPHFRNNLVK